LSSGAGLEPAVLKVHLWFLLSRAVTDDEAKRWLKGAPVDDSIYPPVGVHYTARPLFDDPADDPCFERLALLPGSAEVVVPDLPERPTRAFTPAEAGACVPPPRGLSFKATRYERYMLKCVAAVAEARGGTRHNVTISVAPCLYGFAKAGELDRSDVTARIKGAAVINGQWLEGPDEVNAMLRWAWDNAQPRRLP
jgi:hypothetical protein